MLRDNTSRRRDVKSADVITFMLWQSVWFWRSCSSNIIRVGLCYLCESCLSYSRLVVHVNYVTLCTCYVAVRPSALIADSSSATLICRLSSALLSHVAFSRTWSSVCSMTTRARFEASHYTFHSGVDRMDHTPFIGSSLSNFSLSSWQRWHTTSETGSSHIGLCPDPELPVAMRFT